MELLGCGFNAHGQLDYERPTQNDSGGIGDKTSFQKILTAPTIQIAFAGWSQTVLHIQDKLHVLDHKGCASIEGEMEPSGVVFGDHDGILGVFSNYLLQPIDTSSWPLFAQPIIQGPRISHIAITGAGRVAVVIAATPMASTFHTLEFASYNGPTTPDFLSWVRESTSELRAPLHFQHGGRCMQLIANACSFSVLKEQGDVMTWGDPRHPRLCGRPSNDIENPINKPAPLEALGGLKVTKIASGGWMSAAITEGGDAFIWGMPEPGGGANGQTQAIKEIADAEEVIEIVKLQHEVSDSVNGDVGDDIVDVAVGDGHVVLMDSKGTVWTAGNNQEGQLGLGAGSGDFERDWKQVSDVEVLKQDGRRVSSVHCAPLASFLIVDPV